MGTFFFTLFCSWYTGVSRVRFVSVSVTYVRWELLLCSSPLLSDSAWLAACSYHNISVYMRRRSPFCHGLFWLKIELDYVEWAKECILGCCCYPPYTHKHTHLSDSMLTATVLERENKIILSFSVFQQIGITNVGTDAEHIDILKLISNENMLQK